MTMHSHVKVYFGSLFPSHRNRTTLLGSHRKNKYVKVHTVRLSVIKKTNSPIGKLSPAVKIPSCL